MFQVGDLPSGPEAAWPAEYFQHFLPLFLIPSICFQTIAQCCIADTFRVEGSSARCSSRQQREAQLSLEGEIGVDDARLRSAGKLAEVKLARAGVMFTAWGILATSFIWGVPTSNISFPRERERENNKEAEGGREKSGKQRASAVCVLVCTRTRITESCNAMEWGSELWVSTAWKRQEISCPQSVAGEFPGAFEARLNELRKFPQRKFKFSPCRLNMVQTSLCPTKTLFSPLSSLSSLCGSICCMKKQAFRPPLDKLQRVFCCCLFWF